MLIHHTGYFGVIQIIYNHIIQREQVHALRRRDRRRQIFKARNIKGGDG